jgi:hypothetical protein
MRYLKIQKIPLSVLPPDGPRSPQEAFLTFFLRVDFQSTFSSPTCSRFGFPLLAFFRWFKLWLPSFNTQFPLFPV